MFIDMIALDAPARRRSQDELDPPRAERFIVDRPLV
jgi:hypothetical protein